MHQISGKQQAPRSPKEMLYSLIQMGRKDPALEIRLLLGASLDMSYASITVDSDEEFSHDQLVQVQQYWDEILRGRPIQYQLGYTIVRNHKILVSKDAICPGSQIEFLTGVACGLVALNPTGIAVDLCTGTGVVGIVLAKEAPGWHIYATDISRPAITLANLNLQEHELKNMSIHEGDLFSAIDMLGLERKVDLIICNPPYCRRTELAIRPNVHPACDAPIIAIDGGLDGLDFYRRIVARLHQFLKRGGYLVLEHEVGASKAVEEILISNDSKVKIVCSYEGKYGADRVLVARRQ